MPGRPTKKRSTSAMPGIVTSFSWQASIAWSVSCRSCSPCSASWRRAPSSEASSSDEGDVERTRRMARPTAAGSIAVAVADVEHRALGQRARDLVRAREHGVGAQRQRRWAAAPRGSRSAGPTTGRRRAARRRRGRPRRSAADVGRHAVVRRRDDERGPRVRRVGQRGARARPGSTPWAMPSSASYSGGTKAGHAAGEHEPVDQRRVRVALRDDPRAERREREAQRVVALRRAVGQEPRARGAVGLGREALGLLVGRRRRPEVDAPDVLRDVEPQRAVAEAEAQPGVGAGAALVTRDVEAARDRGSRSR